MNYEFELEEWLPRFPLREKFGHYSGNDITSPYDICNIEWLRRGMVDEYAWGQSVAVDVFVMSKGEPANRYVTKIGGVPYRSAEDPWPLDGSGRPLALIAQFNFVDSIDIVGDLPGDLLLAFGDVSGGIIESMHMEWQRIGVKHLIEPSQIPIECMAIEPCFGNRCRVKSYPDAVQKTNSKYPRYRGKEVWSSYWIPQLQATQIGRAPFYIQPGDDSLPGKPLCTIASVQPDPHEPYPWVNVPEPLCAEGEWPGTANNLMIGDLGCIYISIDDEGKLYSGESCY